MGSCYLYPIIGFTFLVRVVMLRLSHKKYVRLLFTPLRTRVLLCCLCLFTFSGIQYFVYIICLSVYRSMLWCPLWFLDEKNMFGSSLIPCVCGRAHVLFMFITVYSGVQRDLSHMACELYRGRNCLTFASTRVHIQFLVACLDCSFLISTSIFSHVYWCTYLQYI